MSSAIIVLVGGDDHTVRQLDPEPPVDDRGVVARDYAEALAVAVAQAGAWCSPTYAVSSPPPTGYASAQPTARARPNDATTPQFQTVVDLRDRAERRHRTAPHGRAPIVSAGRRTRSRRGEEGAALELALIFLTATSLIVAALLGFASTSSQATAVTRTLRGTDYDADAAMQAGDRDDPGQHHAGLRRRRAHRSRPRSRSTPLRGPCASTASPSPPPSAQRHVVLSVCPSSVAAPCPDASSVAARRRRSSTTIRATDEPSRSSPGATNEAPPFLLQHVRASRPDETGFTLAELIIAIAIETDHLRRARDRVRRRAQRRHLRQREPQAVERRPARGGVHRERRPQLERSRDLADRHRRRAPTRRPPVAGAQTPVARFNWNTPNLGGTTTPNVSNYVLVSGIDPAPALRRRASWSATQSLASSVAGVTRRPARRSPTAAARRPRSRSRITETADTQESAGSTPVHVHAHRRVPKAHRRREPADAVATAIARGVRQRRLRRQHPRARAS